MLLSYDKTSIFAGRGKKTAWGFGGFIYRQFKHLRSNIIFIDQRLKLCPIETVSFNHSIASMRSIFDRSGIKSIQLRDTFVVVVSFCTMNFSVKVFL